MIAVITGRKDDRIYAAVYSGEYWFICKTDKNEDTETKRCFNSLSEAKDFIGSLPLLTRIQKKCDHCGETYIGYNSKYSEVDFCEACWELTENITEEEFQSFLSSGKAEKLSA